MHAIQIDRAKRWAKQISVTGAAQIIVQAVGFLSGILVIRLLPIEQYAYYTIANTMLGTMTVLSDGGISAGVMAQGGKVWQDKEKLGAVLNTGLYLRKRFAWVALSITIPILCYLLWKQGADWITCVLITASLIPAFFAALSDNILQIVPKLQQSITPLQKNQVSVGIGRLLLSGLTLFAFPWAFVAVFASGIPRIWGNRNLKKIAEPYIDRSQRANTEVQVEIMRMVKRILPGSIYFALSAEITVWLLSIFGTTTAVAQIGALGRFSLVFSILSSITSIVVLPRIARLNPKSEKKLFFIGMSILSTFFVCLIAVSLLSVLSPYALWILGDNYSSLKQEFVLVLIAGALKMLSGLVFGISTARGKPTNSMHIIVGNIMAITIGALFFSLNELAGILSLSILIGFTSLIINVLNLFLYLKFFINN